MSIDISLGPNVSGMQGPCPSGFHIPTKEELEVLISAVNTWGADKDTRNDILFGYLKIPPSGSMYYGTGTVSNCGTYVYMFSSSPVSRCAYYAQGCTSSGCISLRDMGYRAAGYNIRPFKDIPIVPDETWTQLYYGGGRSGIFYNELLGLISVSIDGVKWITIQDKNLGASVAYVQNGVVDSTNSGCFYQRGNNYGFPFTGAEITCDTIVNTTGCGPGNYFCCDIFYLRASYPWTYDWSSNQNDNLWGGVCSSPADISNVYIGENEAAEVYVGDVKVWPTTVPVDVCFSYTGAAQCWTVPATQEYCIEVWGAQGGNSPSASYVGGYGGYAAGKICLKEGCTLCIYVGGHPATCTTRGGYTCGWNGGGCGRVGCYSRAWVYAQGGGGGTDVRYNGNTLCHRFIVAGGGAGGACGCCQSINMATIGAGGGECGCSPAGANWVGKQNAAGCRGSFGQGANGGTDCDYKNHAGGGGGGWYGGGATDCKCDTNKTYQCCAGGGSGYTYTASTCGNHPNKSCLGDLPLMTDAVCCPGSGTIPTPSGGTQTGWQGNGCVKITNV